MNINNPYKLIQSIVDVQESLIVIIENEKPILMNRAFCDFFAVASFKDYSRNFGNFINSFVPHPFYFHKEKLCEGESWIEALLALSEKERVVSMLNRFHEPRAFRVNVDNTHEDYAVVSFKDISADLIKSIMIENDVSIDKHSGAYNKDYFMNTSELLQEGARFNEKSIGITLMQLLDACDLKSVVSLLKGVSRQNDILVKYSRDTLLMAYLVDEKEQALFFSKKLQTVLNTLVKNTILLSLLQENKKVEPCVNALTRQLKALKEGELKLV